jgi:pimeloyl-ACP methyl ester carboxylesterase
MKKTTSFAGYSRNGLPYNRVGHGPRTLVIFQGLLPENRPQPAWMAGVFNRYYKYLEEDFTTYIVLRKPGLPDGYSLQDMSNDYATMIREELAGPVDVIGVSTGGSIAQHFAIDHPDLVRKLIIHSSAYALSDATRDLQMRVRELARQRKWRALYATMITPTHSKAKKYPGPVVWIGAFLAGTFAAPEDPSDMMVTIDAEDKFNFKDCLAQIKVPTLVIAGDRDQFYPEAMFRETAEGIPNARLILYKGMGHPAGGEQFRRDVIAFLNGTDDGSSD